jgi:hypothetical protein
MQIADKHFFTFFAVATGSQKMHRFGVLLVTINK